MRCPRFWVLGLGALLAFASTVQAKHPNIVLIYADDLGYGDVGCNGATRVKTPAIDQLAAQGVRFTDAHSPASTCTPSRYTLLTGEYAWRRKGTGILPGDAALIIEPGRMTLPSMLQSAGYRTGVVGKWHLGLGAGQVDWNGDITPGPREIGFDYSFLIPATGDRVPCVYTENQRVVGLDPNDPIRVSYSGKIGDEPTGLANPELLKMHPSHGHDQTIVNGISRIGFMTGGKSARWVDEDMADVITGKACEFIARTGDQPFFLFFALHDIHVPRVPHSRFAGRSPCGPRGDVTEQMDWCAGEIMAALEKHDLADDTILIFTSDNGPVLDDGYKDGAVEKLGDHRPAGPFKGGKYSAFEGGTRVPFVLRWPSRVRPGESAALVSQGDLLASLAALVEVQLPSEAGPDSMNVLPALLGESPQGRDHLVEQGNSLALRKGDWKFIPAGGKPAPKHKSQPGQSGRPQLYNLADDVAETRNLAAEKPDLVRELAEQLAQIRAQGRTRPE